MSLDSSPPSSSSVMTSSSSRTHIVPHRSCMMATDNSNASPHVSTMNINEQVWRVALVLDRAQRSAHVPICETHQHALTWIRPISSTASTSTVITPSTYDVPPHFEGILGLRSGERIQDQDCWSYWHEQGVQMECIECNTIAEARAQLIESAPSRVVLVPGARARFAEEVARLHERTLPEDEQPTGTRNILAKQCDPSGITGQTVCPIVISLKQVRSFVNMDNVAWQQSAPNNLQLVLHCPECKQFHFQAPDASDLFHSHASCQGVFYNMYLRFDLSEMQHLMNHVLPHTTPLYNTQSQAAIHLGVICDGCGLDPLRGSRYKCTVCEDLDLCQACQNKQSDASTALEHPQHSRFHPMMCLPRSEALGIFRQLDLVRIRTTYGFTATESNDGDGDESYMAGENAMDRAGPGWNRAMFLESHNDVTVDLERFICPICLDVARQAKVTPCGHLFCAFCLTESVAMTKPQCPLDRLEMSPDEPMQVNPEDRHVRQQIANLYVQCTNHVRCEWQGLLCNLEKHLTFECRWVGCSLAPFGCSRIYRRKHRDETDGGDDLAADGWHHADSDEPCSERHHNHLIRRHLLRSTQHVDRLASQMEEYTRAAQHNAHQMAILISHNIALQNQVRQTLAQVRNEEKEEEPPRSLPVSPMRTLAARQAGAMIATAWIGPDGLSPFQASMFATNMQMLQARQRTMGTVDTTVPVAAGSPLIRNLSSHHTSNSQQITASISSGGNERCTIM